jgi:peptidoglycan L-alanyl-D-glutamate endopeptidase CwlK
MSNGSNNGSSTNTGNKVASTLLTTNETQKWLAVNEHRLAACHPVLAERVRNLLGRLAYEGIQVLITRGLSTWEEQDKLWAKGRTVPGAKVTNARGGYSQHNYGLAVDLCPDNILLPGLQLDWQADHPAWKRMLELGKDFGLAEGAEWKTFKDIPHFYLAELPAACEQLRIWHMKGGMARVWQEVDRLVGKVG